MMRASAELRSLFSDRFVRSIVFVATAAISTALTSCATTTNPWDARLKKVSEDSVHSSYVTGFSPAAQERKRCMALIGTPKRYATCLETLQENETVCKSYADGELDKKKGGAAANKAAGTGMLAGGAATGIAIGTGVGYFVPGLSLLAPVALAGMTGGANMRANADNELIRVWEESFDECWRRHAK